MQTASILSKTAIFFIGIALLASCGSDERPHQAADAAQRSVPETASNFSPDKRDYSGYYIGKIGDNHPVQMELTLSGDSAAFIGSYYYEASAKPLSLRGPAITRGLTLDETDRNAVKTGTFNGQLSAPDYFTGTWDGNKEEKLPFSLKRVAEYRMQRKETGTIVSRGVLPVFLADNPGLDSLNRILADSLESYQQQFIRMGEDYRESAQNSNPVEWEQDCWYQISYYSDNLVSLLIKTYEYSGGAHGNTGYATRNYRIGSDGLRRLLLADFFRPGSPYLEKLSDLVLADLRRQNAPEVVEGRIDRFTEKDLANTCLTSQSLRIAFPPYVVGPYAAGSYFVDVPLSQLQDFIASGSPLKALLP